MLTPLEKYLVRLDLARGIREGKLERGVCGLCGACEETLVYVGDYGLPERVGWLCRKHKKEVRTLSWLQRSLLLSGLQTFYRSPADEACGVEAGRVGTFWLKTCIESEDRGERARRSAAAGLAVSRLEERGLMEHPTRGHWRLTGAGVALAKFLYPELKAPSEGERASQIALRLGVKQLEAERRRRKRARRVKKTPRAFGASRTRILE